MTQKQPNIYLTLDCEFNDKGLVRELALLLFKDNQIVRILEVLISTSGNSEVNYNHLQNNYHINNYKNLNICINGFLETCVVYAPLHQIKIVGMSLEHDLKSILKTTNKKSLLSTMTQKTQLEMCGRGTLEVKANNNNITAHQIKRILEYITPHKQQYKYHTALYDAIVTGYVYLKVMDDKNYMKVHQRFKKCTHTYFSAYYDELYEATLNKRTKPKSEPTKLARVPKNFPEMRYRVQKNISNVFDVVARDIFYFQLSKLRYEPSVRKVNVLKENIMKDVYIAKCEIISYDTHPLITDPYNPALVHAGKLLVYKKITPEDFVDFAIYMQQYNLPKDKGTYYKVSNHKKEIYIRCLQETTAKRFLNKLPYATIEHFLRKDVPECNIEIIA